MREVQTKKTIPLFAEMSKVLENTGDHSSYQDSLGTQHGAKTEQKCSKTLLPNLSMSSKSCLGSRICDVTQPGAETEILKKFWKIIQKKDTKQNPVSTASLQKYSQRYFVSTSIHFFIIAIMAPVDIISHLTNLSVWKNQRLVVTRFRIDLVRSIKRCLRLSI